MGTITISAAGFAGGPNGSRAGTMNDADYARLIAWARARTRVSGPPGLVPPDNRTDAQVLGDFVAAEWATWIAGIQQYEVLPSSNPNPPIGIT